ncbi:MAG: replication-associated recombination protein A [Candidatus Borkfalkiaceae bacterium]|nr:replication-associated recombination protein A [Christensenellaceae bacterium]MDY3724666.1 replication-associated recombination protein A [Christensenellaceae bacterium]
MYDLFDTIKENSDSSKPLAERMRPVSLREFLGQSHICEQNSLLRRAISLDKVGSCIFWGPPGTGKTTLANIIANSTSGNFVKLNAVSSGVADVKKAVDEAADNLRMYGKKTYLLLDECHRFSKTQSDSLLPAIEKGTIIFIGSTTENPYAAMTPAIVSRCRVFEFKRLDKDTIKSALVRAINDEKRGYGKLDLTVEDAAIEHIALLCGGDLRTAYNALELAVLTTPADENGKTTITLKDAEQSIQRKALSYDENSYYDMLSAFCKSLRGSSSDAALYYAHRLISGGCDPLLIARRLVVHSAEDVGMADPQALVVATSALTAFQNIGYPEGLIPLSEAIIYVCEAPKSNSTVVAMNAAKHAAESAKDDTVPAHLRNSVFADSEAKNKSKAYKYPHDYGGYVEQQYLPDSIRGEVFYHPSDNGFEKTVKNIRKDKGMGR